VLTNQGDVSTRRVLRWLDYLGKEVIVLHKHRDWIEIEYMDLQTDTIIFKTRHITFSLESVEAVFCRGGAVRISSFVKHPGTFKDFHTSLQYFMAAHSVAHIDALVDLLFEKKTVGKNAVGRFNKILALRTAMHVGLAIPDTIFTTKREEALLFYDKHVQVITKSLDINFEYNNYIDQEGFFQYTASLTHKELEQLPPSFGLTIFQRMIPKKYEIRVFFLDGRCYSFAIFSQKNKQTAVDYRCYDTEWMNRCVPFLLPTNVETQIRSFMSTVDLVTGSIDLIYGTDNVFYFLEVNPIGQFGYLSAVNNAHLEREVALALTKND
jgi:ATP-GRASP peptide maturase of grasp-with-spasm system